MRAPLTSCLLPSLLSLQVKPPAPPPPLIVILQGRGLYACEPPLDSPILGPQIRIPPALPAFRTSLWLREGETRLLGDGYCSRETGTSSHSHRSSSRGTRPSCQRHCWQSQPSPPLVNTRAWLFRTQNRPILPRSPGHNQAKCSHLVHRMREGQECPAGLTPRGPGGRGCSTAIRGALPPVSSIPRGKGIIVQGGFFIA